SAHWFIPQPRRSSSPSRPDSGASRHYRDDAGRQRHAPALLVGRVGGYEGGSALWRVSARRLAVAPAPPSSSRVVKVSSGLLAGIYVRWRDEFGSSVGSESDLPVAVVDQPVVVPAEGNGVV